MRATINELWDTGLELISFDDSEFERPTTIADLKQCENVLIGSKIEKRTTEVLIDNTIYWVTPRKVEHPSGGGNMYVLIADFIR